MGGGSWWPRYLNDFCLGMFGPECLGRCRATHGHKAVGFAVQSGGDEVGASCKQHFRGHMTFEIVNKLMTCNNGLTHID